MAKFGKKILNEICRLLSEDSYTLTEVALKVGIHRSTLYDWLKNPDVSDAIKKARNDFLDSMAIEAKRSLMQQVKGYSYDEIKTVYGKNGNDGKPVIKEQTRTKKHVPANVTAIIFTLVNRDPENWKNRQELNGKIDLEQKLNGLSDSQLNSVIEQVLNSQSNGNE